ncbi:hypothetical protein JKP88DRAFT_351602 [Tribonema minus]|uniref:Uncharacterized protein n=1 Tax=Tribonema minus TaxID=303371 RepID=A0A836C8D4_9STRA|nr:hypothetical protein JKP88DRAFT_351602 [Tribonema minus]
MCIMRRDKARGRWRQPRHHSRKSDPSAPQAPAATAKDDMFMYAPDAPRGAVVGVAALVLSVMAAFSFANHSGAGAKDGSYGGAAPSTREPSPARDDVEAGGGSGGSSGGGSGSGAPQRKRVSWHERVSVRYVEALDAAQIAAPELLLDGIVAEIARVTGDDGVLAAASHLAAAKREMGARIGRFSVGHGHSVDGHEKVWDIIALDQRLACLQEDLDERVSKGLPAQRGSSDAFRRCARLKAHYRATRTRMGADAGGGGADGGGGDADANLNVEDDEDEDREYAHSFA